MKNIVLLLLLFTTGAFAQGTAELSGSVIEKTSGQPIPYATITLKQDDKIVSGTITDDKGNFQVGKLGAARYDVTVQFMGFKTYKTVADFTGNAKISLGVIALEEDALMLDEVTVIAETSTIEQKIDRRVINVGRDLTTAGATASEIMNNIPSVNVDQDGNLSLRGNSNVRVLVDGRPTTIEASQLLKQIPATSIKKIELITNPSAKYNPEGMSGIINIVLHKNANDGFNANINAGVTVAKTPKFNSSVNMNYRRGFVNFFGTYGNNFGKYFNDGTVERFDDQSVQLIDVTNKNKGHLVKFGMDFYIDDKNTISVYTNQNFFGGNGQVISDLLTLTPSDGIWQDARYDADHTAQTYNIAYKKLFEREGETLDIELNHNVSTEDQDAYFTNIYRNLTPAFNYADDLDDRFELSTANIDYVRPIGERSRLELGAEGRWFRSQNDFASTNTAFAAADYSYDLNIYSAYVTFGQEFTKISYQLGARFESYSVKATLNGASAYEDDYLTVYPSASMTYKLSDKDLFQLSYSRRVDRPGQDQTKPIREFATPRMSSVGNPELDPQFTNSAEVNYTRTFGKGSLTAGVFVRDIRNEISRVLYPDPEDDTRQIMSFDNFDNNFAFGLELSANYKVTSWWDVQPAIDFSAISQTGLVAVVNSANGNYDMVRKEANVSAFNGRINNNFKANKNLSFLMFGFYRSAVDGIQFDARDMHKIDVGARYSFLNNKATASVRFNDIFNTQRFSFTGEHPYPQTGTFRWESRSVYVGFNYRFGAGKNRELQRRQREDNTKQSGGGLF